MQSFSNANPYGEGNVASSEKEKKEKEEATNEKKLVSIRAEESFTKAERERLEKFFNEKLVSKHALKESLQMLEMLFAELNLPEVLKNKIIESFLLASETKYFDLQEYLAIMQTIIKKS